MQVGNAFPHPTGSLEAVTWPGAARQTKADQGRRRGRGGMHFLAPARRPDGRGPAATTISGRPPTREIATPVDRTDCPRPGQASIAPPVAVHSCNLSPCSAGSRPLAQQHLQRTLSPRRLRPLAEPRRIRPLHKGSYECISMSADYDRTRQISVCRCRARRWSGRRGCSESEG